jgi:hypothetical protein
MRAWLIDAAIGLAIAAAVVLIALFASENSTFVYRGF